MQLNPETLTVHENYRLLIGSVVPRPIALVTTQSKEGVINAAPFSFFNIVSSDPAMVSISVQRIEGMMKDTARNLVENQQAVIHIVNANNVDMANIAAIGLPYGESEIPLMEGHLIPSVAIEVSSLEEANIRLETKLYKHEPIINDRGAVSADLFLLRVVQYHISDDIYYDGKIDIAKFNVVSRLAGNEYAYIGKHFVKERPQLKRRD